MSANLTAVVLVNDSRQAGPILETLSRKGFAAVVESNPRSVLEACKADPPAMVIVEECLEAMTGIRFLSELVRVSWSTATVLISDEEEEVVHQKTEGLGILGHIRSFNDVVSLERLLDNRCKISS